MIAVAVLTGFLVRRSYEWVDGLNAGLATIIAIDCLLRQASTIRQSA
jgi:hypothetical protein